MAISSNEISNIISGQVGMFSASAQYAQAISNQYGFQTGGSIGITDPRDRSGQELQAAGFGQFGARAPGFAMGGLGLMAMMNYAPRMLDPFTMGANMIRSGYRGAGMAGAIGMGGAAIGLGMGVGAVGNFATGNMVTGAQNRGLLNSQISNIFPNMNSGGLNMMASQVESMSRTGMGSIRELATLMQQGATSGALDTGSLNQFSQSFRKLIQNVRSVATVLNSSMTEAGQALEQVKSIGVKSTEAAQFLGAARGIGTAAHISPGQMMGIARSGAQFGFSAGIGRAEGAMGAMTSAGVYSLAQQNENFNVDSGSQGRYTQAATRFLLSSRGKTVLGAMINRQGEFDAGRAAGIARGAYSGEDLRRMYRENIDSTQMRRFLRNRGTEIAGKFITQFGPEAISGSLDAMTTGSVDGVGRDTEMMQKTLTGLNRRDIDNMRQMAAAAPMLKQKLVDEARAGFREGQQRYTATQMMGIAFDRMIKPIRKQFREFGASMTQGASEAMEQITNEFAGPRRRQANHRAEWSQMHAEWSGNNMLSDFYKSGMPEMSTSLSRMPGRATGWASFANYLPGAMRMGSMPEGTSLDELPLGGMTTLDPNDAMTIGGIGLAARANLFPGGRNVFGAAGAATQSLGRGLDRMAMVGYSRGPGGAPKYPWMGFTGVNTLRGAARMPGGIAKTAGVLGRGVGRGLGFLSLPMMAYGLSGALGNSRRSLGYEGISEGAISGNNARLVHALRKSGFLGETHMGFEDITDFTRRDFPGTPVTGIFGEDGEEGGKGYQGFLTEEGEEQVETLFGSSGAEGYSKAYRKLSDTLGGGAEADAWMKKLMKSMDEEKIYNSGGRLQALGIELGATGKKFSPTDVAMLGFRTKGFMGSDSFDTRYDVAADLGKRETKLKLIEQLRKTKSGGQLAQRNASWSANNEQFGSFIDILEADSMGLHAVQEQFLKGNTGSARSLLDDLISSHTNVRGGPKGDLANQILGAIDPNNTDDQGYAKNPIRYGINLAAGEVDDNLDNMGLSPTDVFAVGTGIMTSHKNRADDVGRNRGSVAFSLEQGRRWLGRTGTNVEGMMDKLTDPDQVVGAMRDLRTGAVRDLWNRNQSGGLPSQQAVDDAIGSYMRGGAVGKDVAASVGNANTLIRDWNRVKGRKDRNQRFLSQASKRLGLNLDFSQFKDQADVDYLRGRTSGEGTSRNAITTKLQTHLRELGAQMHLLETGEEASGAQALNASQAVVDALAGDGNDTLGAIERLSTMRPPNSPGSAGAGHNGQIHKTVEAVDAALAGLATRINELNLGE